MAKILYFQQITDSRSDENILNLLIKRINKIKELLNIEGVEIEIGEPYLIDWTDTMKKYYKKEAEKAKSQKHREYFLEQSKKTQLQYRADFRIKKNTRKVTWNNIYGLVNSVKAVPYSFITLS